MRKLILVRHSLPDIVPEIPANLWRLSREGRRRCKILAAKLAGHKPCLIVTSLESKALETGQLVASMLELPQAAAAGIHEHERRSVAFCADEAKFQASVVRMLEQPGQPVFGDETGDQAHQRFSQAIDSVIERYPQGNLAVVTHGTVLSLFVSRAVRIEPIPLWKRLGLPSFVALQLPDSGLLEIVESVSEAH